MDWVGITELVVVAVAVLIAAAVVILLRERKVRSRFRVLTEIARVSDAGGDLDATFEAICDILVPEFADFCMVDLFDDGEVKRAVVRVGPGGDSDAERALTERRPSVPPNMVADGGAHAESLKPRFFERMPDRVLRELANDADDLERLRRIAPRSAITVALNARGKVTGTLTVGLAWSRRRYRREDARFAWILSGRVALALDNCGLFADLERAEQARNEIAETLQRGLLPPPLPHIPGWSIAAMYRPAGAQNEVGGDFYDVFRVPGGWMLAIGDVTGRGARAASITAVARYTLRTAAVLSADPLVALRTLNRALLARGDAALCSLAAVTLSEDPEEPIRLVVAGHPPPLLVAGDSVTEVASADPVLGAFDYAEWSVTHNSIDPGRQLVIVTDGVTEAQGVDSRFGEERLRSELSGASNPAMALRRIERSLDSFTEGRQEDDVAILAIARASRERTPDARVTSPQNPAADVLSLDNVDA